MYLDHTTGTINNQNEDGKSIELSDSEIQYDIVYLINNKYILFQFGRHAYLHMIFYEFEICMCIFTHILNARKKGGVKNYKKS